MNSSFSQFSRLLGRLTGRQNRAQQVPLPSPEQDASTNETTLACGHQLIRPIGRGAYGEVWIGRDEIGNLHAVKVIHRDRFVDRSPFEREYRGLLQYTPISRTHHGLVHVLSVGRNNDAGCFYYVMELADCVLNKREIDPATYVPHTLEQVLATRGQMSIPECVILGLELCEGLGYLHSKQLIHRDIKPANIIFVNGMAKLADIGLITHVAEARRDPKHLGTEGFIPPEGPGTLVADVYSLGKVMIEVAFGGNDSSGSDEAMARLRQVLERACHHEVSNRFQSAEEFQNDLIRLNEDLPKLSGGAIG
jgi:eukaryotic-like serine/threonine-protein kinase